MAAALSATRLSVFAEKLKTSDPVATALCYKEDASKVDKSDKKCARYEKGQNCANCQLYLAKPGAKEGPCQIFQNKIVVAEGWCNGWVKKAG